MDAVTIFVEVLGRYDKYIHISDGDVTSRIPFSEIAPGSEISEDSEAGDEGYLTIPQWLAENDGLV